MERFLKQCTRAALGAALAAVLLAGCAGQGTGRSASAPPASESAPQTDGAAVEKLLDGEHSLTAPSFGFMDVPTAGTIQGCYSCERVEGRYQLCYVDYAAGTRAPLCPVAGCTHKDESCPAYSSVYRRVAVVGDWVLTSGWDDDETNSLDVRKLDGSEKRTLISGAESDLLSSWGFALEGDKVWLSKEHKAVLLDPATGEIEMGADIPLIFTNVGVLGSGVLHLSSNGDELVEEHYQPTGDLMADERQEWEIRKQATMTLSAWDPRTGEEVPLQSWIQGEWRFLRVWNNKVVLFSEEQNCIEARDLVTGEAETLMENWPEDQYIKEATLWDDRLVLETVWKAEPDNTQTWKTCLFALNMENGQVTEITLRNHGGSGTTLPRIMGESEDKFYVIYYTTSEETPQSVMAMISKTDYYAGVDSMVPIQDVF